MTPTTDTPTDAPTDATGIPPQSSNDGTSEEGDGDNPTMRVGGALMRVVKGVTLITLTFLTTLVNGTCNSLTSPIPFG